MDFETKSKVSGDDDLDALEQDVELKKQKKKRIKKDKGKRKWQPLAIDVFMRERDESVRTGSAVAPQRRRLQPLRTDRRDALVGTDTFADAPSDRIRPSASNTQRLRKPSSSDSGTDERCASIAPDTAASVQQQSASTSFAVANKPATPHQSTKGIQSLLDLEVAPTPQALSAVAGIRSSLEYEYRHYSGFPSSDSHVSDADNQSKQSVIAPPPGLTSGISFEIPGTLPAEAPATSGFKFTYESSVDGDPEGAGNEADELDEDEEEAAYIAYSNYGGYAPEGAAAEQYLNAGYRHKLFGRFFDRRTHNEGFHKKGREFREQQEDEERTNDAAASQTQSQLNRFANRRLYGNGRARFARAFAPEQYFDYGDAAYLSPEAYIQGTLIGSADMCIGWGEAFQNDPQELATQQETVAPLSPEQMAALNQYIAQVAMPLVLQDAPTTEKAAPAEPEPSSNAGEEEAQAACVLPLTPEQMLYYCFSLWYLSSGEAGDQVAMFASASAHAQQASASGETAEADSAELAPTNAKVASAQQQEQATHESTERASSPGARATTPTDTSSSTSIAPQTAPSPSTVPEVSAASVDSALSLSSATPDVSSVCASQPSSNSPPEQSSSPAPVDSLGSESSATQLQQQQQQSPQALSFGVFHNGTLYFGAEAARIAAKVLNQGAPAPPMPSLYYCEPLASPLALAAASSQMGSVFFGGAAANASAVGAVAPYFDAYPDAEVLDQQLQRLNLHPAGSGFGDSGSLPLVTA